jgi:polysaccharide biosynthesis protein PelC
MKNSFGSKLVTALAVIMLMAALAGCKDDGPSSQVYVRGTAARPIRIAILDFTNLAPRSDEAGGVVTNAVVTYMLSTGAFDVVEPGVVDQAMKEQRIIPPPSGMDLKSATQLRDALNVDAILTGTVEEYGEVRIGNETYPSVSFSARLIDARDASIVWAGTVSRTGADKVLLFDIKRISSMGKLVKSAVATLATSMRQDQGRILASLHATGETAPSAPAHGSAVLDVAPAAPAAPVATPPVAAAPAGGAGKSKDENKALSAEELIALMPDLPGYSKKNVEHSKHYHDTVTAKYQVADGSQFVEIKLVDYLKMAQTQKFLQTEHPNETVGEFEGLPAFIKTSEFNYLHIDVGVGRFGLFVSGPDAKKSDVEKVASGLIAAIR